MMKAQLFTLLVAGALFAGGCADDRTEYGGAADDNAAGGGSATTSEINREPLSGTDLTPTDPALTTTDPNMGSAATDPALQQDTAVSDPSVNRGIDPNTGLPHADTQREVDPVLDTTGNTANP